MKLWATFCILLKQISNMTASENRLKLICCEDYRTIENWEAANADPDVKWELHHRLEIELNASKPQLVKMGLYYHRPAAELIFLRPIDHNKLHAKFTGANHHSWRSFDTDEIVRLYTIDGKSARIIAKMMNTSASVIYKKLNDAGIKARHTKGVGLTGRRKENHPRYIQIDTDILKDMYYNKRMSKVDIARELGVSEPTLRKRLREITEAD